MSTTTWLSTLAGFTLGVVFASACAGTEVRKSDRWASYPGCNEAQCRSWKSECEAECVNAQVTSVSECEAKCRSKLDPCLAACSG
jgi:hypothetical protein